MFPKLTDVKGLENYRLSLKYNNGTEGIADISHLANKGVFKIWNEKNFFYNVHVDPVSNAVAWNEEIDLCPDALYLKLKGLSFQDWTKEQNATD
jgi:Protein of unknown function (DUF2442)